MKALRILSIMILIVVFFIDTPSVPAQFGNILKGVEKVFKEKDLSEDKIVQGLKEALQVGTGNAVETVSQTDGYFKNPDIKIPLPESVKKVEKFLRAAGYGPKVEAFELSMNRAAERAAPETKAIFGDAVRQMTFSDARNILKGPDNAATLYFKDKTHDKLHETIKPIIHSAMSEVGVTRYYQELDAKVRSIPFAGSLVDFDLDNYVTDGSLEGLFLMLAREEKKIRENPAARVTDLLKEVFGAKLF